MPGRVLIADDSITIRRILAKELRALGVADIVEAGDGIEAMKAAAVGQFDLILLDWNMPRAGGADALRGIRARGSKVPVIMVTSESERARVVEAIQCGANDYLVKPFTGQTLLAKIGRFLNLAAPTP